MQSNKAKPYVSPWACQPIITPKDHQHRQAISVSQGASHSTQIAPRQHLHDSRHNNKAKPYVSPWVYQPTHTPFSDQTYVTRHYTPAESTLQWTSQPTKTPPEDKILDTKQNNLAKPYVSPWEDQNQMLNSKLMGNNQHIPQIPNWAGLTKKHLKGNNIIQQEKHHNTNVKAINSLMHIPQHVTTQQQSETAAFNSNAIVKQGVKFNITFSDNKNELKIIPTSNAFQIGGSNEQRININKMLDSLNKIESSSPDKISSIKPGFVQIKKDRNITELSRNTNVSTSNGYNFNELQTIKSREILKAKEEQIKKLKRKHPIGISSTESNSRIAVDNKRLDREAIGIMIASSQCNSLTQLCNSFVSTNDLPDCCVTDNDNEAWERKCKLPVYDTRREELIKANKPFYNYTQNIINLWTPIDFQNNKTKWEKFQKEKDELENPLKNPFKNSPVRKGYTIRLVPLSVQVLKQHIKPCQRKDRWFIHADTKALLDDIWFLDKLARSDPECRLRLSYEVTHDLSAMTAKSRPGFVRIPARRFCKYMYQNEGRGKLMIGQGAVANEDLLDTPVATDAYVNDSLQLMREYYYTVIISDDIERRKRALSIGIPSYSLQEAKQLVGYSEEGPNILITHCFL